MNKIRSERILRQDSNDFHGEVQFLLEEHEYRNSLEQSVDGVIAVKVIWLSLEV